MVKIFITLRILLHNQIWDTQRIKIWNQELLQIYCGRLDTNAFYKFTPIQNDLKIIIAWYYASAGVLCFRSGWAILVWIHGAAAGRGSAAPRQRTEMARRRCYASGSQAPAARTPALSIIDNQLLLRVSGMLLRSHTGTLSSRSQQCSSLQRMQRMQTSLPVSV